MNEDNFHLGIKAIIRNDSGEILLLKVNIIEFKGYSGEPYWDIPGGRIQKGQTIEETLKREVKEETGITGVEKIEPLVMVLSNGIRIPTQNGDVGLILAVYICHIKGNIPEIKINEESVEANWFDPKEASELLKVKYPEEFVEKIAQLEK